MRLEVSSDGLSAHVVFDHPEELENLQQTKDRIDKILSERHVAHGVLWEHVQEAVEKKILVSPVVVAKGLPPLPGKDALLEEKVALQKLPDLNHPDLDLTQISRVEKDQLIMLKIPASQGTPGRKVTGEDIPAPCGADAPLPEGEGTYIKDGLELRAHTPGLVYESGGKVCVEHVLVIDGDVSAARGNISFPGKVLIRGSVKGSLKIEAEKDVLIKGNIEGGHVTSSRGSIRIEGGVKGAKKSILSAAVSIAAKFAEYAKIVAGKDVDLEESLFHTEVEAGEKISVRGGKGVIVGGKLKAGLHVEANVLGSRAYVFTEIQVATPEQRKILDQIKKLQEEVFPKAKELERMRRDPKKAALFSALQKQVDGLKEQISVLKKELGESLKNHVTLHQKVFPGTCVEVVGERVEINQEYESVHICRPKASEGPQIRPLGTGILEHEDPL